MFKVRFLREKKEVDATIPEKGLRQNFAKTIESEHDEVISLIVESDRNFSGNVASTSFFSLRKRTLNTYIHTCKTKSSLLLINRLKSIDFRRHKKYKFAFLQGFFWFKVAADFVNERNGRCICFW